VEVAATIGNDDNVRDRLRYAEDTVAKFEAGEKRLAGGPSLAKELGEPVVARLREWLPAAAESSSVANYSFEWAGARVDGLKCTDQVVGLNER
jgi:hypothetical protein